MEVKTPIYLATLCTLSTFAYAEDYASNITTSQTIEAGEVANITENLSVTGTGVVLSANGTDYLPTS